jgi:hypothetical protein
MHSEPPANGPTITARLSDGPQAGTRVDVEVIEGRPPKIVDLPDADGTCRYCLADWMQSGSEAVYTFLYRV